MEHSQRIKSSVPIGLLLPVLAGLACNFGSRSTLSPAETVPVSTEAIETLKVNLSEVAKQATQTGQIALVIDESQFTSLLAFELQSRPDIPFSDPQVLLRDGRIRLTGKVTQGNISTQLQVEATANVDEAGSPHIEILSARLGPLPVPGSLIDELSTELDKAFSAEIKARQSDLVIELISIADGKMTIQGHLR